MAQYEIVDSHPQNVVFDHKKTLGIIQSQEPYYKTMKILKNVEGLAITGAPGMTRTPDLRIRSPLLYPAELQALKP